MKSKYFVQAEPQLFKDNQELKLHEIKSEAKEPTAKRSRFFLGTWWGSCKTTTDQVPKKTKRKRLLSVCEFFKTTRKRRCYLWFFICYGWKVCQPCSNLYLELRQQSVTTQQVTTGDRRPPHSKLTDRDCQKITPINCGKNSQSLQCSFFFQKMFSRHWKGSKLDCFSGRVQSFDRVHVISRFQAPCSRCTLVCISPSPLRGSVRLGRDLPVSASYSSWDLYIVKADKSGSTHAEQEIRCCIKKKCLYQKWHYLSYFAPGKPSWASPVPVGSILCLFSEVCLLSVFQRLLLFLRYCATYFPCCCLSCNVYVISPAPFQIHMFSCPSISLCRDQCMHYHSLPSTRTQANPPIHNITHIPWPLHGFQPVQTYP